MCVCVCMLIYISVNEVIRYWIKAVIKTMILCYCLYLTNEETTNWDGSTLAPEHMPRKVLFLVIMWRQIRKLRKCGFQTFPKLPMPWGQTANTSLLLSLQGCHGPYLEGSEAGLTCVNCTPLHRPSDPSTGWLASLLTVKTALCLYNFQGHVPWYSKCCHGASPLMWICQTTERPHWSGQAFS